MIRLLSLRATRFKQLEDVSLTFPQRGSVLIQGLNEAGKSTLFESVFFALFGKALVTEEPNRLDDLVHYQSPRALVRLAFATDGASFAVSRAINRGKPNSAVLEVEYVGGKRETVTNLTSVNRRIEDELGLNAEALLNSCFVEQKKLEKLESMTAQQRRDTLLRLLNLDRLSALEARYKPAPADEPRLQALRDRLRLAEVQRDLPLSTARLAETDAALRLLAGVRLQREIASLGDALAAERRRQADLDAEAVRLEAALAGVERLEAVRDLARAAGETLLAIEEDAAETDRLRQELARHQQQAASLPELEAELARLEAVAADLAGIAALEEAQARRRRDLARLAEAGDRVRSLRATLDARQLAQRTLAADLAAARAVAEHAEAAERQARQAELLRGWLQIREVAGIAQEGERRLAALRDRTAEMDRAVAVRATQRHVRQWTAFGLAVAALLAAGVGIALAARIPGVILAALLAGASALFVARASAAGRDLKAAEASVAALRLDLSRGEGEQALARRTGQDPSRLAAIEAELAALGLDRPATVEAVHALLATLESAPVAPPASDGHIAWATPQPDTEPPASAASARERLGTLDGQRQALDRELAALAEQLARAGDPDREHAALLAETEAAEAALDTRRTALDPTIGSEAEAREQAAAARAGKHAAEQSDTKAAELATTLDARQARAAARQTGLATTWQDLQALIPEMGLALAVPTSADGAPLLASPDATSSPNAARTAHSVEDASAVTAGPIPAGVDHAGAAPPLPEGAAGVAACRALWREAGERIGALDEPRLREAAAANSGALATSRERARVAERRSAEAAAELAELALDEAQLAGHDGLDTEAIQQREAGLRQERDALFGQVASQRDRLASLEHQLGMQAVALDVDEAQRELATFEEQLVVRKQAHRIVALARREIVGKVLPSTVRNMGLLLPLLTNDRYRDVDIDPETYKIKVWDESARAMKAKDIFSGGTRDQFSLALRLAFALATLPEELGAAPGFIFLDEPLSSFDSVRGGALVNLLTKGPIAANFDQIFVISHSRAFDESLFDYHLQLEAGRIAASDLPAPEVNQEPVPSAQMSLDLAAAAR